MHNTNQKLKNRWLIALSAVGIHISIGSVYAWSHVAVGIKQQITSSWNLEDITLTFSIAIFCLGLSASFLGYLVEEKGPKFTGILSTLLYTTGLVGASFAVKYESLYLLYATYGILCGMGLGLGYITPVSTLLKWFPEKRGFATGITIMGFGFGAVINVFLLQNVLPRFGISDISSGLFAVGCIYFVIMLPSSLYLEPPVDGWFKDKFKDSKKVMVTFAEITAKEAIKTIQFYYLWIMLFTNITCGIAIISVAKFIGIQFFSLSTQMAAAMVMLMSLFNGLGRISWASLSDYITRPITYIIFFVLQICAFWLLTYKINAFVFQLLVFLIMTCYGGGFASIPAFIADIFGVKEAGRIHGYILTAWAAAGLVGPKIIAYLIDKTGEYTKALYVFVVLLFGTLLISFLMLIKYNELKYKIVGRENSSDSTKK